MAESPDSRGEFPQPTTSPSNQTGCVSQGVWGQSCQLTTVRAGFFTIRTMSVTLRTNTLSIGEPGKRHRLRNVYGEGVCLGRDTEPESVKWWR